MSAQAQDIRVLSPGRAVRPIVDRFDGLCIALLLISFLLVSHLPAAPSKYGDLYFHEEAKALAHAMRGTGSWNEVSFARAPGPALYYAVPYLFLQANSSEATYWRAATLWNCIWMVVAILLIRRAGELLEGELAGKIAAVVSLALPFAVYYSFGVAAETPAYVATVIFTYGWASWRASATKSSAGAVLALAGLVALILCRPNALVLFGIGAAAFAGMLLIQRETSGRRNRRFAILGSVASIATVLLVSFGLKLMPGNRGVTAQTSNMDIVMFLSTFQFRTEPWDWSFWGKMTRQGSVDYQNYVQTQNQLAQEAKATGTPISRLQLDYSIHDAIQHPWIRAKMIFVRLLALNIWIVNSAKPSAFHIGPLRGKSVYLGFHFLLNAVALMPVFLSIIFLLANRKNFFELWPLWGLWIGLLMFHAATYAEPRYMLPAQPGLAVMAACVLGRRMSDKALLCGINTR
jgi:hypothetical protein